MKKARGRSTGDIRREYDFSKLTGKVVGKYYRQVMQGTNLVRLDPDVAEAFPDGKSVNDALRMLVRLAQKRPRRPARARARQA